MPERDAFLRMICENPADDGPRLVFADWLEEQGDTDRSEFIRLQCERARLPPVKAANPHRRRLSERSDKLCKPHRDRWRAELPSLPGVKWGPFHRGFVHIVEVASAEVF